MKWVNEWMDEWMNRTTHNIMVDTQQWHQRRNCRARSSSTWLLLSTSLAVSESATGGTCTRSSSRETPSWSPVQRIRQWTIRHIEDYMDGQFVILRIIWMDSSSYWGLFGRTVRHIEDYMDQWTVRHIEDYMDGRFVISRIIGMAYCDLLWCTKGSSYWGLYGWLTTIYYGALRDRIETKRN